MNLFARTIEFEGRTARLVVTQDVTEKRRSERLQSALYRIAEVSTTAGDLSELYPAIHGIVAHLLDAKNFYIALHEVETSTLTFPDSRRIRLGSRATSTSQGTDGIRTSNRGTAFGHR